CFEQVQQSQAAAAFEPTLSLMLAVSWSRAGQSERSADVLTKMRRRWPKARFDIAGRPTQMPASEAEAKQWLSGLARARPAAVSKALADWTMTGGDSSRAAQVAGGRPLLLRPCWRQRVAADANIEQIISVQSRQLFDQSVPALPAMHPLAVGNVVLMRGPGRLTAVDAESGKIVWQIEPVDDGKHDTDSDSDNDAQPSARDRLALSGEVYERIWQDRTVGTLSSDGELVFSLEDVGAATAGGQRVVIDNLGSRRIQWAGDQQSNVLAAYEVRQSQGKRRWSVGGPGGVEPKLDHAFFLGPPLPLQGRLYVIAEMAGEIRLVVLSADSGRLQWSQQLAVVDDEIAHETSRHTYGISPSFADGTLICPTTVGAVVGVDLTTRLLLWGYQYPRDAANGTVVTAGNWIARRGGEETNSHPGWSDGCPMISGGRVILTPPESSQLHCLNLRDGRLLWHMDRGRNLYAAGFHGDNVILVGQDAISLVAMVGPEKAKGASLALPEGSMPSGRGYCTAQDFYLPMVAATGGEVLRVDLDKMRIADRVRSHGESVPGNLICHRGQILSQGADSLECYYQLDALKERVSAALAQNANDPWGLYHRGELLIDEQRSAEAIPLLRQAYQQYVKVLAQPADAKNQTLRKDAMARRMVVRDLLVEGLLEHLKADFTHHKADSAELASLIEIPEERLCYLRIVATGLEESGDLSGALRTYFEFMDQSAGSDELIPIDRIHSIAPTRWLAARLAGLEPRLSATQRTQFDEQAASRWKQAEKSRNTAALQRHSVLFGDHPTAVQARLQLAGTLSSPETVLARIRLLEPISRAGSPEQQREATARLAQLLAEAGRPEEARPYYRRLLREWADTACLAGRTGRQVFEALPAQSPLRVVEKSRAVWPGGAVKVTQGQGETNSRYPPVGYQPAYEISALGTQATEPLRIFVDPQQQLVSGMDRLGRTRWRMQLSRDDDGSALALNRGLAVGQFDRHLLMLSIGNRVMAVNTLRTGGSTRSDAVLWSDDVGPLNPANLERVSGHTGPNAPWEDDEQDHQTVSQGPVRLGPVVAGGVVYQRSHELVFADPLTGKKLWVRRDIPAGCMLIGDAEVLLAIPPQSTEARVLRTGDGMLLGRCQVPSAEEWWLPVGRRMVTRRFDGGSKDKPVLALYDPWTKKEAWKYPLPAGSKVTQVDDDSVAVLDREGHFAVLDLASGATKLAQKLEPEPKLAGLYVVASRDTLLVIANQRTRAGHGEMIEAAHENGGPLITGRIYGLDPKSGRPLWPVPATLEDFALVLEQPSGLPVAVFARRLADRSGGEPKTAFLFLDKRTGSLAAPTREFAKRINNFEISGDEDKKSVTVYLRNTAATLTLTYTDQPTPPEPPIQIDAHRYAESRALRNTLGSAMKALSKASEQLQGLPADDDEQEKDLFGK
ncbi:MAG: PQQ-like beta-propeller repeat protein, partial [Planctomycetia bacterium]|nr:PQQ-like beta-propeller repeat protein [Planctomycetia bacterium]